MWLGIERKRNWNFCFRLMTTGNTGIPVSTFRKKAGRRFFHFHFLNKCTGRIKSVSISVLLNPCTWLVVVVLRTCTTSHVVQQRIGRWFVYCDAVKAVSAWQTLVRSMEALWRRFTFTSHSASISFAVSPYCNQILSSQNRNIFDLYCNHCL